MDLLWIILLMVLNFGISWWNARSVGSVWIETKVLGGWPRLVAWSGAVMSASGFTWCYLIVFTFLGSQIMVTPEDAIEATAKVPLLSPMHLEALLSLGYLMIIVPVLGSGIIITLNTWREAIRRKSWGVGALAGYNSFAQIYNTYNAVRHVPAAFEAVGSLFKGSGNSKSKGSVVVVMLAIAALFAGILTTYFVARSAMQRAAMEEGVRLRRAA